jgi:hypothetical protein
LLIRHMRGRHALAGVAVAMQEAHSEFEEGPEKSHFLGHNLAGAQERD